RCRVARGAYGYGVDGLFAVQSGACSILPAEFGAASSPGCQLGTVPSWTNKGFISHTPSGYNTSGLRLNLRRLRSRCQLANTSLAIMRHWGYTAAIWNVLMTDSFLGLLCLTTKRASRPLLRLK